VCLQINRMKMGVVEFFRARVERVEEETIAVFTLNDSGIILSCNRNFVLPLFGYKSAELRGQHIKMLMPALSQWPDSPPSSGTPHESPTRPASSSSSTSTAASPSGASSTGSLTSSTSKISLNVPLTTLAKEDTPPTLGKRKLEHSMMIESNSQKLMAVSPDTNNNNNNSTSNADAPIPTRVMVTNSTQNELCFTGVQHYDCLHKDGSLFRVALTLARFTTPTGEVLYSGTVRRIISGTEDDPPTATKVTDSEEDEYQSLSGSSEPATAAGVRIVGDYQVRDR
jgi:hypothetical protein